MAKSFKKRVVEAKAAAKETLTVDQFKKCNAAIHSAAALAATEAFVPIPVADAIPITATQIAMIVALGKVFNQKISKSAASGIIVAAASAFVGRNLVKLIPVAGWVASSVVAAGITEAIGWTVALGFAQASEQTDNDLECAEEDAQDDETSESNDESIDDGLGKIFEEDE